MIMATVESIGIAFIPSIAENIERYAKENKFRGVESSDLDEMAQKANRIKFGRNIVHISSAITAIAATGVVLSGILSSISNTCLVITVVMGGVTGDCAKKLYQYASSLQQLHEHTRNEINNSTSDFCKLT